jgi:hypothetical protein
VRESGRIALVAWRRRGCLRWDDRLLNTRAQPVVERGEQFELDVGALEARVRLGRGRASGDGGQVCTWSAVRAPVALVAEMIDELFERSLVLLWDDLPLTRGELYSSVAEDDIYRWQLQRFQLQQRRGLPLIPERLPRSNAISESNFLRLQVDDLNLISRLARSPLSDLDHGLTEFRASIPSAPIDMNLGTVAQAVAVAIAAAVVNRAS